MSVAESYATAVCGRIPAKARATVIAYVTYAVRCGSTSAHAGTCDSGAEAVLRSQCAGQGPAGLAQQGPARHRGSPPATR